MKKKSLVLLILLLAVYVTWALLRPLPALRPEPKTVTLNWSTGVSSLSWPTAGQSAVGIVGSNILETHGLQVPVPTASTAKVITALLVLKKHPLAAGQPGPLITLGPSDEALYANYANKAGSTVPVTAGEQIHEYQMLEAMLLPSANNMADSLTAWAYGSLPAYSAAANSFLKQNGLKNTTVGSDASGFMPSTVSTAHDLVKLGELAMQNPVIAEIVNKPAVTDIPYVPNAKNVNFLLGTNGIVGIKTGNTDQAGGVYIAAARTTVNQKPVTIVTAIMGAPTLFTALKFSLPIVQSAEANFKPVALVNAGDVVAHYQTGWDGVLPVAAGSNLIFNTWQGANISATLNLPPASGKSTSGQTVSHLTVKDPATGQQKSISLVLGTAPVKPSIGWRLTHPL